MVDPEMIKRNWRYTLDELIKTKYDENARRWRIFAKDKALATILDLPLIETRAEHFLAVLNAGKVSTNVFLRRLHNFALGFGWLLAPVIPPRQWPKVRFRPKRGITLEEHTKVVERELNPERRAFYHLLWELGGSQGDIARLNAEDVDWSKRGISYARAKTGQPARVRFDEAVEEILRTRPSQGPLFPYLRTVRAGVRAAIQQYHAERAPLYPLPEIQRLGYLDEEDAIDCKADLADTSGRVIFRKGQRYSLRSETVSFSRLVTRPNNFTGEDEELQYSGQELAFLISAKDETEWCFMDAWLRDDPSTTVGNAKRLKDNSNRRKPVDFTLQDLVTHFVIPEVPDVAAVQPEAYTAVLGRLAELEQAFAGEAMPAAA